MTGRMLTVWGVLLVLAAPELAAAGEVRLSIQDGRVALVARDATLREILVEWERVGGTRIVNRDRVPGARLNLELTNVTEEQALATLLRSIAGYMASRRLGPEGGASAFSRIVLMAAPATPAASAAAPAQAAGQTGMGTQPGSGGQPFGRPGMQRRVLPDGRVVTVTDDPQQAGDPDDPSEDQRPGGNAPSQLRPPFNAPQRMQQGEAGGDAPQPSAQPGQVVPTTSVAPVVPATVGMPGALPVTKPGATPPPPIKPPGD